MSSLPEPSDPTGPSPDGGQPRPAAPPSDWSPAPLAAGPSADSPGRAAAAAPSGRASAEDSPVTADDYAPPRSWTGLALVLVAVAVAALVFMTTTLKPPVSQASATPSPTRSSATASPSSTGQPFEDSTSGATGTWEVIGHEWTGSGVNVELRIHVDGGSLGFTVFALNNTVNQGIQPEVSSRTPALVPQTLHSGQETSGWVYFPTDREDVTVSLCTDAAAPISALAVPN